MSNTFRKVRAGPVKALNIILRPSEPDLDLASAVEVEVGDIGYSRSTVITSANFMNCCAIILDFGGEALMAHALPAPVMNVPERGELVNIDNVVPLLCRAAERRGLDIKKCRAIVQASSTSRLYKIIKRLGEANIPVGNLDHRTGLRTVEYDPITKELRVIPQ